jgi:hypothetical protein
MATVEDGGVTHAAQVEIPASDPEIEADSIQRINDELECLAAHMNSLFGLLSYLGHKVANDDLNLSSAFFALANNAEAAQNTLNSLVERLAPFEPLTVKHSLEKLTAILQGVRS